MPSIDHLLGHTASQLKTMTDAEILEKYADCFKLEPPAKVIVTENTDETTTKVKKPKKPKEVSALQGTLLNLAQMQEMLDKMKIAKLEKMKATTP